MPGIGPQNSWDLDNNRLVHRPLTHARGKEMPHKGWWRYGAPWGVAYAPVDCANHFATEVAGEAYAVGIDPGRNDA